MIQHQHDEASSRLSRMIGLTANVLTIIVSVIIVLALALPRIEQIRARAPLALSKSVSAPNLGSDISYAASEQTLALVIRSDCPYCQASIEFYKKVAVATRNSKKTQIVAVFPKRDVQWSSYLQEQGVPVAKTVQLDLRPTQIRATPTLLLVDRSGVVRGNWVGVLADAEQRRLLSLL